jgi:hypothetical protein
MLVRVQAKGPEAMLAVRLLSQSSPSNTTAGEIGKALEFPKDFSAGTDLSSLKPKWLAGRV